MKKNHLFSKSFWASDYVVIGYFAVAAFVLHLIAIEGFGYFRDELYYISCSNHLALGYVDQPPLSIFFLKILRTLFGDSRIALRIFPAIAGAAFIYLTGVITKELGAKRFGLILATAAAFAPIGNFFIYSVYSMNFLDHMFWLTCMLVVLRIIKTGNSRLWLLFGLLAGLGAMNKISVLFLGFGVAVGMLLTDQRKHLKSKYLWMGAALAGLLFLPYIIWNMTHDWAHLEFINNAKTLKMVKVSPIEFFLLQVRYNNPGTLLIWLAGLWFFFFNTEGKKYRLFGWMYLSIYILFTLQQAKDYYLAGIYPILFAGGAIFIETILNKKQWNWPKPVLVVLIVIPALIFCPVTLPIFPAETTANYARMLGIVDASGENHKIGVLPQHFADMHGWEGLTEKVAGVYNTLTPEEKENCILYGTNYGVTGALNFFGKKYNLPPAFSGHNNHYLWPPEGHSGDIVIFVGSSKKNLLNTFNEVIEMGGPFNKYAMPHENKKTIHLCKGIKKPLMELWPNVKHYE